VGYPAAKRAFDVTIAAVLLIVLAPVFAFLVAAMGIDMLVRRADRGPWLYRETRISRGIEFELLKFRTLRVAALATMSAERHARLLEADESKLTWAGRRLLKPWYLDELPQLWNILRGDMSLVGPRPWPPSMVTRQVSEGLTYRNEFVAGWTGSAQVQKGLVETAHYTELDCSYVEFWRHRATFTMLRRDLGLLRRTIAVMLRGEGLSF